MKILKISSAVVLLASLSFLTSCASPRVKKWEGRKITLCCQQYTCKDTSWSETVAKFCSAQVKQVGAETVEKVVGYTSNSSTEYNPKGKNERANLSAQKEYDDCRTYECSQDLNGM